MDANLERINKAWKESKAWITEFDGTAYQTVLPKVSMEVLPHAFQTLANESDNFRVSIYSAEAGGKPEFVSPESIQLNIARLLQDEISGLDANFAAKLPGYDLDLHLVIHTVARDRVDLEFVWWSDQAFPDDTNYEERFRGLAGYFIYLQSLFKSPKVYIGPESLEEPGKDSSWVEV
jgi:hypothetical protein